MKTKPNEAKSAKTLKGQLFGALSMMLVAAIALGTSTYAWFINNQTVELETMNLTVSTSTSLLVSVGKRASVAAPTIASNWTGYKTVVTNNDITGTAATNDPADWTNLLTNPMTPASVTDASLTTAVAQGSNPTFFYSLDKVENNKLVTFDALGVATGTTADEKKAELGEGYAKLIPLRFLSSTDNSVYFGQKDLTALANLVVANGATDADTAQAAAIRAALRVAVVSKNSGTYDDGKKVVFQFDDGTAVVAGAGNNTEYGTATGGGDIAEDSGKYKAIASVVTDVGDNKGKINTTGQLTATLPTAVGTGYLATVAADTGAVTAPETTPEVLFTLKANEARDVDLYIWLEGTDQDCVSALSGYKFGLVLPFAAPTPTAP